MSEKLPLFFNHISNEQNAEFGLNGSSIYLTKSSVNNSHRSRFHNCDFILLRLSPLTNRWHREYPLEAKTVPTSPLLWIMKHRFPNFVHRYWRRHEQHDVQRNAAFQMCLYVKCHYGHFGVSMYMIYACVSIFIIYGEVLHVTRRTIKKNRYGTKNRQQ